MRPEHWLFTIPLRLRSLFRWAQADQELDDELRDHLERKTEEYLAQGMTHEQARRHARLDLGGIEQTKEKCRDARRVNWIQDFVQDLRYGLRMLQRSPGFSVLAVLVPIDDIRTMQQLVQGIGGLFLFRLAATVAAVMGVLGLVLAIVGVYGVISYSVSQRTNEIGIRMALGAGSDDILKLVSAQGLRLVGFGMAVGLLAAWALSRAMKSLLVGVNAVDPVTFVTVAVLLGLTALAACLVPARGATRVDPMVALRYE